MHTFAQFAQAFKFYMRTSLFKWLIHACPPSIPGVVLWLHSEKHTPADGLPGDVCEVASPFLLCLGDERTSAGGSSVGAIRKRQGLRGADTRKRYGYLKIFGMIIFSKQSVQTQLKRCLGTAPPNRVSLRPAVLPSQKVPHVWTHRACPWLPSTRKPRHGFVCAAGSGSSSKFGARIL
eukprot:71742-Pelagomonas_calceolata.AAC.1